MFPLFKTLKTKHCISETSSGATDNLKKVPMVNIYIHTYIYIHSIDPVSAINCIWI
jgi:hypothetical protein